MLVAAAEVVAVVVRLFSTLTLPQRMRKLRMLQPRLGMRLRRRPLRRQPRLMRRRQ
jgi:hypothetical protein